MEWEADRCPFSDIVLLQESLGPGATKALGKKLFGVDAGILTGVDAPLIVRGRVIPAERAPDLRSYFVQARVVLRTGTEVEVICDLVLRARQGLSVANR
jgi:hypothetical protein